MADVSCLLISALVAFLLVEVWRGRRPRQTSPTKALALCAKIQ